jgi:outer membrane immunogenic protein
MRIMKVRLLCSVALPVFIAAPAMAADLPVKAPLAAPAVTAVSNWSGFYVGVNAGGAWARSGDPTTSASCTALPGAAFGAYFGCGDIPTVNAIGSGSMSRGGFTGGAQAGYNWQSNSTVVGVETDFEDFHAKASRMATGTLPVSGSQATITNSVDANWLFTARGRLGWAFNNNLLAYATGGLAVTRLSTSNSYVDNLGFFGPGVGSWSASATKAGWTAGGGVEWAFSQHWSARAEYLYVHFDPITASGVIINTGFAPGAYGGAVSTSTDLSAHIARGGVNYKF